MQSTLERFHCRVMDEWLPDYCNAPKRQYDIAGFRPSSIRVNEADAEDCMQALDSGVVFRVEPGKFAATRRSGANKNAVAACESQPPRQRFSST